MDKTTLLQELERPFEPATITWKPGSIRKDGTAAMALAYGDLRVYMDRLDEVCGLEWSVAYTPWADKLICNLTIAGTTRSSTGEPDKESERGEIAGTVTEAQAFKRACAMFGLGRYLYKLPSLWVEWDNTGRKFTPKGQQTLASVLDRHYKDWQAAHMQASHRGPRNPEPVTTVRVESGDQIGDTVDLMDELHLLGETHYTADNWPNTFAGWMASHNLDDLSMEETQFIVEFMRAWGTLPEELEAQADSLSNDVQWDNIPGAGASDADYKLNLYQRIQSELVGNERLFVGWAMQKQESNPAPASEAQYGYLAKVLDELTGNQHGAVLSVLVGRPVSKETPIGKALAGGLLDFLLKQTKERGATTATPNPKYAAKYEAAVKNIAAAALAAMGDTTQGRPAQVKERF
jgi:hypothetical protein